MKSKIAKYVIVILHLVCMGSFVTAQSDENIPFSVIEQDGVDSLRLWHLYDKVDLETAVGEKVSFLGKYDPRCNTVVLCEPPWIFVKYEKLVHWRISFNVPDKDAPDGVLEYRTYLKRDHIEALMKQDRFSKYSGHAGAVRKKGKPELFTLAEIYGKDMPLGYREFDARKRCVSLEVQNQGGGGGSKCKCFVFQLKEPLLEMGKELKAHRMYAYFTGTVERNRSELPFFEKNLNGIPQFVLDLTDVKPVHVEHSPGNLTARFHDLVRQSESRIRKECKEHNAEYKRHSDDKLVGYSWYKGKMALTTLVSPKVGYTRERVPYGTVSVLFDPGSGKPLEMIYIKRVRRDPLD